MNDPEIKLLQYEVVCLSNDVKNYIPKGATLEKIFGYGEDDFCSYYLSALNDKEVKDAKCLFEKDQLNLIHALKLKPILKDCFPGSFFKKEHPSWYNLSAALTSVSYNPDYLDYLQKLKTSNSKFERLISDKGPEILIKQKEMLENYISKHKPVQCINKRMKKYSFREEEY